MNRVAAVGDEDNDGDANDNEYNIDSDYINSDDKEPSSGNKCQCNGGRGRAQQLKAHQIKSVLNEWKRRNEYATAEGNAKPTKNSLLKWARKELIRPKLQRVQLNKWLNNEEKYRAAAVKSVHVTS